MKPKSNAELNFPTAGSCVILLLIGCALCGCGEDRPPQTARPTSPEAASPADQSSPVTPPSAQPLMELAPLSTGERPAELQSKGKKEPTATPSGNTSPGDRLADDRPPINELRLKENGINQYSSRRLVLLSDLPAEHVTQIPALADQLFDTLEKHFGKLPDAIDGSDFQVTGHLIDEEERFQAAGLMPSSTFTFDHGRHLNYQFWMFSPKDDYYRRHLLFHEFTHCFMTCESGMQNIPALWYIEGMAEFFATHRIKMSADESMIAEFGIMPDGFDGFEGWGRISELRRTFSSVPKNSSRQLPIKPLSQVMPESIVSFVDNSQYAESWAMCWLIQSHSEYREALAGLAKSRTRSEFFTAIHSVSEQTMQRLATDWLLVVEAMQEGYDVQRSFPVHAATSLTLSEIAAVPLNFELHAAAGWQSTGLRLKKGEAILLTGAGQFQVNDAPRPWISEPQGVSIEYFRGRPLGQVVACFVAEDGVSISDRMPVGREAELTAPFTSMLWLQLNDSSAGRKDNGGSVRIVLTAPADSGSLIESSDSLPN